MEQPVRTGRLARAALMESQDTEITLGSGRLLGLFFGLALLCGVFFAMGFTLGRNTGTPAPIITPATTTPVAASPTIKPAAAKSGAAPCPDGQTCDKSSSDELSFIKSDTKPAAPAQSDQAEEVAPDPVPAAPAPAAKPAPEMKAPSSGAGFVVQIAAVSKKDDADALLGALRKKNYPVFISSDANDHLYHVQVGPYTDRKDANTMKDKLAGDGYNAIVK